MFMIVQDRHQAALDCLKRKSRWTVDELMARLRLSRSTVRRVLIDLEAGGKVVRVHGGVVNADSLRGELTFDHRHRAQPRQKQAIGAAAAGLVQAGQRVYIDAGTTALEVGRRLMHRPDVRLYTHSVRLLSHASLANCSITCIGGEYRAVSDALVGGLAMAWLDHLHVDVVFVGSSGLCKLGASTTELSEAAVKRAILQRAKRRVLVCDSAKWDVPAAMEFAEWKLFDTWVTDAGCAKEALAVARKNRVKVIVAD